LQIVISDLFELLLLAVCELLQRPYQNSYVLSICLCILELASH